MGLDPRESTPGFKRQLVVLNAELRSLKRAALVAERVIGQKVSTNTIERICLDVADDVLAAEQRDWKQVITGEVVVPSLAIVEFDGGRIRTRQSDYGPGVHLAATGWNETKNAIFVSATSTPSNVDPQPDPPRCFLDAEHVVNLAEAAKPSENKRSEHETGVNSNVDDVEDSTPTTPSPPTTASLAHCPRLHVGLLSEAVTWRYFYSGEQGAFLSVNDTRRTRTTRPID